MKDFRDELLKLLLDNVGEFVDITHLVDKYCGEGNTFDDGDDTKIKCRLNINLHLRELKDLGWINMTTQGGLSASHKMNHDIGKRQFTLDYPVKVRMTTNGEIGYKAMIKQETPSVTNIQTIGVSNGIAAQQFDLKNLDAAFQPTTNPPIVQNTEAAKHGIITSIGKWILNHIVAVIIAGLILAFIIYKLGWNK